MKKIVNKTKAYRYLLGAFLFGALLCFNVRVMAQTSSSNYKIEESHFGTGGQLDANSGAYNSQQSTENGSGNTSSTNYQANGGFNTTDAPFLEMVVTSSSVDLGVLSPSSTSTTTSTFYVRAYLASGYSIVMASDPPTYGTHQITPLSSQTASSAGTEQFGVNLRANTSPAAFGADPSQSPDSSFSYGYAAPGYDTANVYKYVKNDVIAKSDKSSGRTDYTISYIFNISALSTAGSYIFNQDLVALATY